MGSDTIVTVMQWLHPGHVTLRHDRNTNRRKLQNGLGCGFGLGDCWVLVRSNCAGIGVALAIAFALGACTDANTTDTWFSKRFDMTGRSAGYTFSELSETKKDQHPITPNDLVNANGSCPAAAAPAVPAPAPGAAPTGDPSSSMMGSGVALGISECDLVSRAGQPTSVQIGNAPNGDRTAVLTFQSGPRPGIYHFVRGALTEMDSVGEPAAPPPVAKKKPAKPQKNASQN
jgi:hypothetical protein